MTNMFRPAVRQGVKALLCFYGPSGCGKTYSAILAARGLVGSEGKIAFLDTEAGRGSHYAHLTNYDIMDLAPPFTPSRYLEAIEAAEEAGYDALIIDSISHEWEGEGGVLEQAEAVELRTKRSGLHCWAKPKAHHKKLINRLLRSRLHLVFCARAREKPKQVKVNGKTEIVSEGFEPIVEKNFPFEMLVSVGFSDAAPGVPDFSLKKKVPGELKPAFPDGEQVGVKCGATIAAWLGGGAPVNEAFREAAEAGREVARRGSAALSDWWEALAGSEKRALKNLLDAELKSIARAVDDFNQTAAESFTATDQEAPRGPKGSALSVSDDCDPFPGDAPAPYEDDAQ